MVRKHRRKNEDYDREEISSIGNYHDLRAAREKQEEERGKRRKETKRKMVLSDLVAGLINSIANVPDAIATSFMAGVSPIHGLYATIFSPAVSSMVSNSQLMITSGTVAAGVAVGDALASVPDVHKLGAMYVMAFLIGAFLILFGILRLGRLQKYVSYSVMRGFLYGIGLLLILEIIPDLVGYSATGTNVFVSLFDTFTNIDLWNGSAVILSAITFGLIYLFSQTRLDTFALVFALTLSSLVVYFLNTGNVQIVMDVSVIPSGFPSLVLPDFSLLSPQLIFSSFSIAVLIAVQGAGVSEMAQNPDGQEVNLSKDMLAQGAANIASGFLAEFL